MLPNECFFSAVVQKLCQAVAGDSLLQRATSDSRENGRSQHMLMYIYSLFAKVTLKISVPHKYAAVYILFCLACDLPDSMIFATLCRQL